MRVMSLSPIFKVLCGMLPVFLLPVVSVQAEMWTNAAGHAIEAEWVGGDARSVTLERPNGERIRLSLLSLSPGSRKSAQMQLEKLSPGNTGKTSRSSVELVAGHAHALFKAGRITARELQAILASLPKEKLQRPQQHSRD
jgi:hypothetical protein